jgi:hypothetical protein
MATKINDVPYKRPETETPTVVNSNTDREEQKHKHMEKSADRLAHKANKDHQQYDKNHTEFSI